MEATSRRLPYAPGLDGLRAVALLGIIAYHVGFSWIPGGFYSVDTFFVLSGYLITSLLIVEWTGSETIGLRRFWARRARRLLPALFVLIAGLGVLHLVDPGLLPWTDAIPDAAATLGYVANWHFIATSSNYFAATNSPLLHTWSLSIEEQFYLVWPLLVLGVLSFFKRMAKRAGTEPDHARALRYLFGLCVVGALASAAWMWRLTPSGSSNFRAYYGTDTRAQSLLIGAAIAVGLKLLALAPERGRRLGAISATIGLIATAAIWYLVPWTSSLAFHGGFLLAALAAGGLVTGVVLAPAGLASRALAFRPLRYIGTISYGAYLWYWPVYLVLSPERAKLGDGLLFACNAAATLSLAAISAKLVELPIRRGHISSWRALVGAPVAAGLSFALVAISSAAGSPAFAAAPPAKTLPAGSGEAVAIKALHGGSGQPVRVLFVGDSMAGTLAATLSPYAQAYGVQIINEGHPGCSVSTDSEFRFLLYEVLPGVPCEEGQPDALLDLWRDWVNAYRPNVVVYLGRTELMNQKYGGSWTWLGNSGFDDFLSDQLQAGVKILGSRGARVVLMTSPYYDSTIQGGGPPVPEDAPGRVVIDDQILREVATSDPGVTIFPLGQIVTPHSVYAQDVGGVDMRCSDGVHFSVQAGQVLAPALLPFVLKLSRSSKVVPPAAPPSVPAPVPSWYYKLQCGQS